MGSSVMKGMAGGVGHKAAREHLGLQKKIIKKSRSGLGGLAGDVIKAQKSMASQPAFGLYGGMRKLRNKQHG